MFQIHYTLVLFVASLLYLSLFMPNMTNLGLGIRADIKKQYWEKRKDTVLESASSGICDIVRVSSKCITVYDDTNLWSGKC